MLPDFIVIGAFKAGTTSLHQYFDQHPGVFMTRVKEPNYFSFDPTNPLHTGPRSHDFPIRTAAQYEALFDEAPDGARRGEASPAYLHSAIAPERLHAALPDARLIVSLRSPVDRAYSHFEMAVRSGRSPSATPPPSPGNEMWFRASLYADALDRYLRLFGRSRVRCVLFDELTANPAAVMRGLFDYVGVDATFPIDTAYGFNPGGLPRHPRLYRLMQAVRRVPGLAARVPVPLRRAYSAVRDRNLQKTQRLDGETRARWTAHYRSDIERTAELTGLDLSAWLGGA